MSINVGLCFILCADSGEGLRPKIVNKIICKIMSVMLFSNIFSPLWCTKTYSRLTIENWFNGFMLVIIHRDIKIIPEEVVEEFSKKDWKIMIVIYVRN